MPILYDGYGDAATRFKPIPVSEYFACNWFLEYEIPMYVDSIFVCIESLFPANHVLAIRCLFPRIEHLAHRFHALPININQKYTSHKCRQVRAYRVVSSPFRHVRMPCCYLTRRGNGRGHCFRWC